MTEIRTDYELQKIFYDVGEKYGFTVKKAEFIPFADFKVTWECDRRTNVINFKVSDYAMNMSEKNIKVIAEMMFRRINNMNVEGEYKDKFNETVLNKNFVEANRAFYIERKKLEKIPFRTYEDVEIHWSKVGMYNAGFSSTLMKVIALNPELMSAPKDVIDTVIKMQYNIIQDGVLSFGGEAKHVKIEDEEISRTKQWLVNNDIKLNDGLFN